METALQPKGLPAISRGLSETTPPEGEVQLRPRRGSQIVLAPLRGAAYNVSLAGGIGLRPQPPMAGKPLACLVNAPGALALGLLWKRRTAQDHRKQRGCGYTG